jgi:glutaredoxin-like protein NrdH
MKIEQVGGENHGKIFLYTLSTCIWCRKMKRWLDSEGLEYSYVDVDLAPDPEQDGIMDDIRKWNPSCSFPTVVVNNEGCFSGYDPEKLEELLRS